MAPCHDVLVKAFHGYKRGCVPPQNPLLQTLSFSPPTTCLGKTPQIPQISLLQTVVIPRFGTYTAGELSWLSLGSPTPCPTSCGPDREQLQGMNGMSELHFLGAAVGCFIPELMHKDGSGFMQNKHLLSHSSFFRAIHPEGKQICSRNWQLPGIPEPSSST